VFLASDTEKFLAEAAEASAPRSTVALTTASSSLLNFM
jgi:hypothetical protein